jgi:acrylyl-CoA reductase (NADPH)
VAVSLLAASGYTVHAATGRPALADGLKALGASEIVPRAELDEVPARHVFPRRCR